MGSVCTSISASTWCLSAGVSGNASLGLGAGCKLLVGGSHKTISLQPLALQAQMGVNLALGVADLALR
jgi:hypothetical protein